MDLETAKKHWEECRKALDPIYEDCQEDWEFLHGVNHWDESAKKARHNQRRPCLTLNLCEPYANQVTNDMRQARLAIRVTPNDSDADVETAEILQGIIRNIEKQSKALNVYTRAFKYSVGAGIGYICVDTDYESETSFDQEIKIKSVERFQDVYLDPNSKEIDGSDAEYGFVRYDYTRERFQELYPDATVHSFCDDSKDDEISVVKYYYKEYEKDTIYAIRLIDGSEKIINSEQKSVIDEDGTIEYELLNERKTEYCKVMCQVWAGDDEPLEEEEFPSKFIPIIPVVGHEVYINDRREFHSLIRQAKDAQRMYNYHKSESVGILALQPKAPYIAPVGSFKTNSDKWAAANVENFAYLEYDIVYGENDEPLPPPMRQPSPQGSAAMMQEAMAAKEDIRLAIGMTQANMGEKGNEISGIAVRNRQIEGDNATFHFIDNLGASIAQLGTILVDMIPRIYNRARIVRIIGEDGTEENVPINQPFAETEQGKVPARDKYDGIYNLGVGSYDVSCDVGASYSSKRQETADKLIELINAKPELADVTGDLLFEALDLPKAKEISKRLKAMLPPELQGDDPQAAKIAAAGQAIEDLEQRILDYEAALQNKQENAQFEQSVKMKELDNEQRKLVIESQKAAADIQKTMAEIEKMRAETKGFDIDAVTALGNAVNGMSAQVQDITQAMNIILDGLEDSDEEEEIGEPMETAEQATGDSEND